MDIDEIQRLTGTDTPGSAVEAVRALVLGYPGDDPPLNGSQILVHTPFFGLALAFYEDGEWLTRPGSHVQFREVTRWWELPPVPGGEK